MGLIFTDNFNSYSDGALATASGGVWNAPVGGSFGDLNVVSHAVIGVGAGTDKVAAIASWSGHTSAHWIRYTARGTNLAFSGPCIRVSSGKFLLFEMNTGTNQSSFTEYNGGFVRIDDSFSLTDIVDGDIVDFGFTSGNIVAIVNSSTVRTKAYSGPVATGAPGARIYGNTSGFDDTEAGDYSVVSGTGILMPTNRFMGHILVR